MERNRQYINHLMSLSKEDFFSPFKVEWVPLYGLEKQSFYIRDIRNTEREHLVAGPRLQNLLDRLVPQIERYPYTWSLEGQSIDPEGYDFSINQSGSEIEMEPVAYTEALRRLNLPREEESISTPIEEGERVFAPHLTKLQLTFEKASPLSVLSFQFFSKNPVTLMSMVSERELNGNSSPEKVNLNELQIEQANDTVTILFGKPIFSKRLTFVLGQHAADSNTYYVRQHGEDFTYAPTGEDRKRLVDFVSSYHAGRDFQTDEIYTDREIRDWSPERIQAYQKWRDSVTRRQSE